MGILKKLASQTAIYGVSSIVGRFLNYLLVPLYTYYFSAAEYGVVAEFYAYAGFFAVLLLFGFETGYFRFRDQASPARDVAYSTALIFVLTANLGFFALMALINAPLAAMLHYADHPEYVLWFAIILTLDAIGAIAFARLRAGEQALRFATIKIIEILVTILLSLFFIVYCPKLYEQNPHGWVNLVYNPAVGIGYIFIANLIASLVKFILLAPQLRGIIWGFDSALFGRMLRYSLPMVVIGFAGIINEMLDRVLLKYLLPYDLKTNMAMLGIYSACYKLSILMTLFIQAFRFAAEPFFFAYADKSDARAIYAEVLKYFVIFCVGIFLLVTLYIDFFKYFIGEEFRAGLPVVPILLLANLFLGIYVNLSIWYKLTDRTLMGAWVALGGAALTIGLNIWWIPVFGYLGSAWATLACYGGMALVSYLLGRKFYPVEYDIRRILGYILLGLGLYGAQTQLTSQLDWRPWITGTALLLIYLALAARLDGRAVLARLRARQ
ncbi:MAG: polysaccharide biosynthesis protein [Gammaproteobacteria bacterium RBG_16_57_12]|nr:MAG: polysaccharide biosynthesis protein [Gammaproteobacteria bacterium RBG_16_57_12]